MKPGVLLSKKKKKSLTIQTNQSKVRREIKISKIIHEKDITNDTTGI